MPSVPRTWLLRALPSLLLLACMEAHRGEPLTQEQLLGKALEFAFRFNIAGPLMPYGHTIVPPGPQLLAP